MVAVKGVGGREGEGDNSSKPEGRRSEEAAGHDREVDEDEQDEDDEAEELATPLPGRKGERARGQTAHPTPSGEDRLERSESMEAGPRAAKTAVENEVVADAEGAGEKAEPRHVGAKKLAREGEKKREENPAASLLKVPVRRRRRQKVPGADRRWQRRQPFLGQPQQRRDFSRSARLGPKEKC